jgi:hypothetical protein
MEPVKKQKKINSDDSPGMLAYYTIVRNIMQEMRRLNQMPLFNTLANVDLIVEKLPLFETEKWMEETEGLRDHQMAATLEKFVLDRWRHYRAVVARSTSAELALKPSLAA